MAYLRVRASITSMDTAAEIDREPALDHSLIARIAAIAVHSPKARTVVETDFSVPRALHRVVAKAGFSRIGIGYDGGAESQAALRLGASVLVVPRPPT
jgi:hypothetical protein